MNSRRITFNTYEVITPHNVHLDDNSIVQAIGIGSIVVITILEHRINQIHIKGAFHV